MPSAMLLMLVVKLNKFYFTRSIATFTAFRMTTRVQCHSIFAMSLARSFHSDPHGMIFIHASCDQPLMNSPITKLSFVILSRAKNLKYDNITRNYIT